MPTVVFQVIARETNTVEQYTASTEVIINVIDVNDETPQITIVSELIWIIFFLHFAFSKINISIRTYPKIGFSQIR